ncbi:MAG: hypothetical protein SXU28_13355 [Pseudomonadota bacterium]|nr:hypothetical protein [Pseudomonadota bacterium]
MKNLATSAAIAAFAAALPSAAFAQDATPATEVTIGATAGIHDLGVADDVQALTGLDTDDSSPIFGGFVSVDVPVAQNLFVGAEGNLNFGTDALDADYGASLRAGFRADNGTKVYVRGGYQWVEIDYAEVFDVPQAQIPGGLEDTFDDYLVGAGVDVPVGGFILRANVDTISFDTVRATAGVGFKF